MTPNHHFRRFRRAERGAALVEAAITIPLVLTVILAIAQAGIYFGQTTSLTNATRTAARAAVTTGSSSLADFDALNAVRGSLGMIDESNIETIVVYHADSPDSPPSPTCAGGTPVSGNGAGACNVYTAEDFDEGTASFGPGNWSKDNYWPAWERSENRGGSGPDFLGVYIEARCSCMSSPIFSRDTKIKSSVIMQLEARKHVAPS